MDPVATLIEITQRLALETAGFFDTKGPGAGNIATNAYIAAVREQMMQACGYDYSEQMISGDNRLCVDYYFPEQSTVVEIALGLFKPKTEFEKDVLKVVMAREAGVSIERLVLIGKPGSVKKCRQPGRQAVLDWLSTTHGVETVVMDLRPA